MIGVRQRPGDLQNTFPHHLPLFPKEEGNWCILIVNFASGALTHPACITISCITGALTHPAHENHAPRFATSGPAIAFRAGAQGIGLRIVDKLVFHRIIGQFATKNP